MRLAGRPSWRFGYGNGSASDLHASLFARDAAGLAVSAEPDVPPSLASDWLVGGTPSGLAAVTSTARAIAASQWLTWWRRLVEAKCDETQARPPAGGDTAAMMDWLRARAERFNASFDPPRFASLASTPELRAVVAASYPARRRRSAEAVVDLDVEGGPGVGHRILGRGAGPRPRSGANRSGSFDYDLIRSIAEQTAAEFGVPIDAIDGTAHVLDVQGSWWHVAGPGCVLCSPAAITDAAEAAQLLSAVFASQLR